MKIDLEVESVENGWILSLDGRKYVCKSPRDIMRKIMAKIEGRETLPHPEAIMKGLKEFWRDKIGTLEKKILEIVERDKYTTLDKLTDELAKNYPTQPKWATKGNLKTILLRLVKKGYLKRTRKGSKKYQLTDKRPVAFVKTSKPPKTAG